MTLIYQHGRIAVYAVREAWGLDYWVYGVTDSGDPRVCPSLAMAMEIAH
jgi:hypothetical protein